MPAWPSVTSQQRLAGERGSLVSFKSRGIADAAIAEGSPGARDGRGSCLAHAAAPGIDCYNPPRARPRRIVSRTNPGNVATTPYPVKRAAGAITSRPVHALDRLMRGRTTLVFAHPLSSVIGADRLLVLEEGRVVETGTHAQLMARAGLHRQLVDRQIAAASG